MRATVIRPPVKPDPRINLRAWVATGTLVPPPIGREAGHHLPVLRVLMAPVVLALAVGVLIGWGLR